MIDGANADELGKVFVPIASRIEILNCLPAIPLVIGMYLENQNMLFD